MKDMEENDLIKESDAAFKAYNSALDALGRAGFVIPIASFIVSPAEGGLSASFNTPLGAGIKALQKAIEEKTFETSEELLGFAKTSAIPMCWLLSHSLDELSKYYAGLATSFVEALPEDPGQLVDGVETLPETKDSEVPS